MKKIIAIIMLTLLIFSSVSSAFSETLTREEIPLLKEDSGESVRLVKLGILKGTGESLALDKTLTRAEAVCLIFRMHPENPGVLGMPSPEFSDLDSHWAYKEVTAAKKMGLVEGTGDDKFEPDRLVTGKEFAKIILSLLGYDDVTITNITFEGAAMIVHGENFTLSSKVYFGNDKQDTLYKDSNTLIVQIDDLDDITKISVKQVSSKNVIYSTSNIIEYNQNTKSIGWSNTFFAYNKIIIIKLQVYSQKKYSMI